MVARALIGGKATFRRVLTEGPIRLFAFFAFERPRKGWIENVSIGCHNYRRPMISVRGFHFVVGCVVLLAAGCVDRPSVTPAPESSSSPDTLAATGAAKRASTWQKARQRGVQFRAIGQEPGWIVEVTADSLRVEWNYGQQVASGPRIGTAGRASSADLRYRSETEEGPVEVEAVERRCVDPMNGDAFPMTVTVRLETDTLSGCGKVLRD